MYEISLQDAEQIAATAGSRLFAHYSGRFMYDQDCVGFVVDGKARMAEMMRLGAAMWSHLSDRDMDLAKVINESQTDDLGVDSIVYFQRLRVTDE